MTDLDAVVAELVGAIGVLTAPHPADGTDRTGEAVAAAERFVAALDAYTDRRIRRWANGVEIIG